MRWKGDGMAKSKAGEGTCPACSARVVWRLADSGSLSCFCQDCDFQGYAKEGTEAKRLILAKIGAPPPPAAPAAANDPAPPRAAEPKKSAFGVFGL